jgi:hypothetical protein
MKYCDAENPCPLHEKYAPIRASINKLIEEETVQSLAEKVYQKEINIINILK